MKLEVGNRIKVEAESTERTPRTGVIEEVVSEPPSPRYRVRWDDGHESIYTPGRARWVLPSRQSGRSRARANRPDADRVDEGFRTS